MSDKNILMILANKYLDENPEKFNEIEKQSFINYLNEYKISQKTIRDEIYDFFVHLGIYSTPRHEVFAKHIITKYPQAKYKKVLDVGAGRMCKLSQYLSEHGYVVDAMDPNIRLNQQEIQNFNINKISKTLFTCDELAQNEKGTSIENYDLIVGLEPCLATEHILRQSVKYKKPCEILLCYEAHTALDGTKFNSPEEWFDYLSSLSQDCNVNRTSFGFVLTTNKDFVYDNYLEDENSK